MLQQSAAIENSIDGVAVLDEEGEFVYLNEAHVEIYGYDEREELLGRRWSCLYGEEQIGRFEQHTFPALREHGHWRGESVGRRRDGSTFPQELSISAIEHGGCVCVVRDITERKRAEELRREGEERFRHLVEQAAGALFVHDLKGRFVDVNQKACELLGYTREELLALSVMDVEENFDPEGFVELWERVANNRSIVIEGRNRHKDGTLFPVEIHLGWYEADGERLVLATVRDITERKRAEEALRESEERFRTFFEHSATGIAIATPDRRLMETNPAYQHMTGYTAEELLGKPIAELSHPDDVPEDGELNEQLSSRRLDRYRQEKRYLRKDGETVWVRVTVSSVRNTDGETRFLVGMVEDITERKVLEESLAHRASHDPLTGLPNRSLLTERLSQALARADRKGWSVALLFLDLDNFKVVNDSMGHEAGDRLLVAVTERLREILRPEDMVARLGGDEFVVLLEETDLVEAAGVADRIAEGLTVPFVLGDAAFLDASAEASGTTREILISASVGIALSDPARKEAGQLLQDADLAMYRAKAQGKARHAIFEAKTDEAPPKRLDAENRFRRAVERGEILPYYQPKVSIEDGEVIGMEALARWVDPDHGLVFPSRFISLAEETGLIVPMGQSIMREACRQAAEWRRALPGASPVVWVNLSPRQFHRADVVGQVSSILGETGLDPRCLGLEITEGVVMDDAESTIATLRRLKSLGVQLAVDDFGKGYSSLNYVKRFPVDCLKVDRSFVSGICEHPEDLAIVQAVITLGRALGMQVVAEGVESAEQLDLLRGLGCDHGQGYHFARPMPGEEASLFLAGQRDSL